MLKVTNMQISKRTMRRIMVKVVKEAYDKTNLLVAESLYDVLVDEILLRPEEAERMAKLVYPFNRITLDEVAEISRLDKTTEMSSKQLTWVLKRVMAVTRMVQLAPGAYEYSGMSKPHKNTFI